MNCNRENNFKKGERHVCFGCGEEFNPKEAGTCRECNWKIGVCGHCACSLSKETKEVLDRFYDIFCEPHSYSKETKYALSVVLKTFIENCRGCLE